MRHSVFAGGKRLRPVLAMQAAFTIAGALPAGIARLGAALAEIMREGPARSRQLEALSRLDRLMALPDGGAPSSHAARAVLETIQTRRGPAASS